MKRYRFNRECATAIWVYDSMNVSYLNAVEVIANARVGVIFIQPNGVVGYHEAVSDQLFMVVQGKGWTAGADHVHMALEAGQAVHWKKGEWHETGSQEGMSAVIIEAEEIHPTLEAV